LSGKTTLTPDVLVLGIGNLLLGDEAAGVCAARLLAEADELPQGVEVLDGGTGSLVLLEPMHTARRLILVDAALDGNPAGTFRRIVPRHAQDFPPSLTAHDIGLKDLLDTFYLIGKEPDVVLYAISIAAPGELGIGLSPAVEAAVQEVVTRIQGEWVDSRPQQFWFASPTDNGS